MRNHRSSFYRFTKASGDGAKSSRLISKTLDGRGDFFNHSKLIVLGGHHEYWTRAEFKNLSQFVFKGGSVANFSGNTYWGQVNRVGGDIYFDEMNNLRGNEEACDSIIPPIFQDTGYLGFAVYPPTERLLGVSYRFGGYPIKEYSWLQRSNRFEEFGIDDKVLEKASGVYIQEPTHPVFKGLNFSKGQRWGKDQPLVSIEVDGAL